MLKLLVLTQCVILVTFASETVERKPIYKYRYETEDVMKTAASSIPVHGYHVVEGGYYPGGIGMGGGGIGMGGGGGYIGGGGIGLGGGGIGLGGGGIGLGGVGMGLGGAGMGLGMGSGLGYGGGGIIGGGMGGGGIGLGGGSFIGPIHHGFGGGYIDKSGYSGGKKNVNDGKFEKVQGKKGGEVNQGQEGYSQGKFALKNSKGDKGYYSGAGGGKNLYEDGKQYHGAQQFDEGGKKGAEANEKNGHKKGHSVKGYKTTHHKDESGKTEEYYDEANDEGGQTSFNGEAGSFGKKGASSFKGGHEDGKFNSGEQKKQGHYDSEQIAGKSNADAGKYGENKYAGNGEVYGANNGFGAFNKAGHEESSKFYKHHPQFYK